jgi:hypothetical protein
MDLTRYLRDVPDFPKKGILFKDITPLLAEPKAMSAAIDRMANLDWGAIDKVAAIESRGFLFGVPLAMQLGCGFVPIRKPGKLPWKTNRVEYVLEYASGCCWSTTSSPRAAPWVRVAPWWNPAGPRWSGAASSWNSDSSPGARSWAPTASSRWCTSPDGCRQGAQEPMPWAVSTIRWGRSASFSFAGNDLRADFSFFQKAVNRSGSRDDHSSPPSGTCSFSFGLQQTLLETANPAKAGDAKP